MAKKYYAQKLFDFMRPSNPSTDGTFRSRATKFFDRPFRRARADRDATAARSTEKSTLEKLPLEILNSIAELVPNELRLLNYNLYTVVKDNETSLWSQAWIAKEKAKKSNNAVSDALPDSDPAELSNPENALQLLIYQFHTKSNIPLEKIAEAFVNIANNPKSDGKTRITAFEKLGKIGGILEMKEHSPRAARIAAWGLRELIDSAPRETDDRRMHKNARQNARRCLESLTGNEKKCMDDVLDSKTATQPTAAGWRPTAQILLSALKRPAKTWKLIQDTRHRGRSGGGRV